jgi:catechol 2,3-dioxygenase-like lactoylglutathione lyase family enzyme
MRARAFYRDKLGLEPVEERRGGLRYVCGPTEFHVFSSTGPTVSATVLDTSMSPRSKRPPNEEAR